MQVSDFSKHLLCKCFMRKVMHSHNTHFCISVSKSKYGVLLKMFLTKDEDNVAMYA